MDTREKTTEFGDTFVVPTWIERIGNDKNHRKLPRQADISKVERLAG